MLKRKTYKKNTKIKTERNRNDGAMRRGQQNMKQKNEETKS